MKITILNKPSKPAKRGLGVKRRKTKLDKYKLAKAKEFNDQYANRTKIKRSIPFWQSNLNPITLQPSETIVRKDGISETFIQSHSARATASINGRRVITTD